MTQLRAQRGYTLVEIVIVIIVLGVLAGVAVSYLGRGVDTAKYEHTRRELESLAHATVGNAEVHSTGARADFGYVGDVGALPPDLTALATNPGYATWNGPYISSNFDAAEFTTDAWGAPYQLIDTVIRSTGSGNPIDRQFAPSKAALLNNSIEGTVIDANNSAPGLDFADSLQVVLTYPDGAGSYNTATAAVNPSGYFSYSGIPIGRHDLAVVYLPTSDTTHRTITVYPARPVRLNVNLPVDFF